MDVTQFATRVRYQLAMLPDGERTREAIALLIAGHVENVASICLNTETCHEALHEVDEANNKFCNALLALADTETPLAIPGLPPDVLPFLELPDVPPLSPPSSPN